jgi:hypothetical protein
MLVPDSFSGIDDAQVRLIWCCLEEGVRIADMVSLTFDVRL